MRQAQELNAAFQSGDRDKLCAAIFAVIMGTGNVSAFALRARVDRTMLYTAFKHNPGFDIILKVMRAADFKLIAVDHPESFSKRSLLSQKLSAALDTDDIRLIIKAFSEALHAQENIFRLAEKIHMSRAALYRTFACPRVPRLGTLLNFLNALNLRLAVKGKMNSWRPFNAADLKTLRRHSKAKTPTVRVAQLMNRSVGSLQQKCRRLNIPLGHRPYGKKSYVTKRPINDPYNRRRT
jgi:DNA-binding phage protein